MTDRERADAQAMALVKKFKLSLNFWPNVRGYKWWRVASKKHGKAESKDLNRAIRACVKKIEIAK